MVFRKHEPENWIAEQPGQFIAGILVGVEKDIGIHKSTVYQLKLANDKIMSVWGSTVLDRKMTGVDIGKLIKIEFTGLGEGKAGSNKPKLFDVYVDDGGVQPPTKDLPNTEGNIPQENLGVM